MHVDVHGTEHEEKNVNVDEDHEGAVDVDAHGGVDNLRECLLPSLVREVSATRGCQKPKIVNLNFRAS